MIISLIAAMGRNRVIGKDNDQPWDLPADWAYFKRKTLGKPCIMGRKTHEAIGKPLPERTNIIITRDRNYKAEGCVVVHSIDEALRAVRDAKEIMVIGGAEIYSQFLIHADRLYLTFIDADFEGDAFFPWFNETEWAEVSSEDHEPDENNPYRYRFVVMERKL